ncbi:MAG: TIGR02678 family protein [Actinomycetota bacterium]|nr:TIGR02678 family protein [Actinomycetota bacterium]
MKASVAPSPTSSRDDAERQDALRLLLRAPLISADGPHAEVFRLVRRHREELARDVRQLLGYRLVVEAGFARLYKAGLGPGRARPLRRASGTPFSPRAYAYLALCCSVLITGRQQVLLSALVEQVRSAAAEAGIELGGDSQADRRAFVAALRQLVAWDVLVEDDGVVSAFADDAGAEALLFVRRDLVRHLLAVPLREVEHPDDLVRLSAEPGAGAGARHRVRRLLVEEPGVLADDVDDESWAWLRQSQRREARTFEEVFGLELEIRAEGVAAIDPHDELTDEAFPRGGTLGHAALLAVSELARRLRPQALPRDEVVSTVAVPAGLLEEVVAELLERHGRRWKQDYMDHPERLTRDVEDLLVAMGLLRRGPGGDLRLAAIANRYAPEVVVAPAAFAFDPKEAPS